MFLCNDFCSQGLQDVATGKLSPVEFQSKLMKEEQLRKVRAKTRRRDTSQDTAAYPSSSSRRHPHEQTSTGSLRAVTCHKMGACTRSKGE